MKKHLLLFLLAFFTVTLQTTAAIVERSYTIEFKTSTNKDGTQFNSSNKVSLSTFLTTNSLGYISDYGSPSTAYYNTTNGLRLGSGSNVGSIVLNLSSSAQVEAKKITADIAFYGSDTNANIGINNSTTTNVSSTTYSVSYPNPSKLSTLSLYMKRGYIKSVTVYYDIEVPDDPTLNFSDGTTVNVGDQLTISCGTTGATLSGTVGTTNVNGKAFPYTYTFTAADAGTFKVSVAATKDNVSSNVINASYSVVNNTQGGGNTPSSGCKDILTTSNFTGITYSASKEWTANNDHSKGQDCSGAVYKAQASSNKGFQLRTSQATGITVLTAPAGMKVSTITIDVTDTNNGGGGVSVYKGNSAFDIPNKNQTPSGNPIKTGLKGSGNVVEIDAPYFIIVPTNDSFCVVGEVTVNWEIIPTGPVDYVFPEVQSPMDEGTTQLLNLTTPLPKDFSIVSNDKAIADVDNTNNQYCIKAIKPGTANFTATWSADDNYNADEKTFSVQVNKVPVDVTTFAYSAQSATWDLYRADGETNPELPTLNMNPAGLPVTYTSTNPAVASVGNDGAVTPLTKGTTVIKATFEGNEDYKKAETGYTLTVLDSSPVEYLFNVNTPEFLRMGDEPYQLSIPEGVPGELTITANTPEYATIDDSYNITAVSPGEAVFTAAWTGNRNFKAGSKDLTITIKAALIGLDKFEYSAAEASYDLYIGEANASLPKLSVEPEDADIKITYSSSDPNVASVDNDGKVTPLSVGVTTITATFAGNDVYSGNESFYTLTVSDSDPAVSAMYNFPEMYSSNTVLTDKKLVKEEITLIFEKAQSQTAPQYYTNGSAVRAYAGSTFTISGGAKCAYITKIDITFGTDDSNNNGITSDKGTYTEKDGASGSWVATDDLTNEVKFTIAGTSGNRRIQTINVYYIPLSAVKPSLPVVKIGDEELTNGESKTVFIDTQLEITSENATSIVGSFGEENIELTATPFVYTISSNGTLSIKGKNEGGESETFTYTFTIGEVDPNMPPVGSNFRQVLNVKDKTDYLKDGEYYVLGRHTKDDISNPVHVAMSTTVGKYQGNNNITSTTNVTFTDDIPTTVSFDSKNGDVVKETTFTVLTTGGEDVLIFKAVKNENDEFALRTVNFGDGLVTSQKYLSAPSSDETTLEFSDEFTPLYLTMNTQDNVNIKFSANSERTIGTPQSGNYFNYQKGGGAIQLYEYSEANLFVPEYDDIILTIGESQTVIPKNKIYPENITYRVKGNTTRISIEDGNIVTADEREGSAVIIASWPEVDHKWFAGRVEIPVTIKKVLITEPTEDGEFYFRHAEVRGKIGVGVVAQAVYYAGNGTVTYSIMREGKDASNEIAINTETGMIRPEDIEKAVIYDETESTVYTVVAKVDETDNHLAATASYTIIIEAPEEAPVVNSEGTEIWSSSIGGFTTVTNTTAPTEEKEQTSTETNITYVFYQSGVHSDNYLTLVAGKGYVNWTLPWACSKLAITTASKNGTSDANKIAVYADGNLISEEKVQINKQNETYYFDIPTEYKKSGTVYSVRNVGSGNSQIASFTYTYEVPNTTGKPELQLNFNDEDRVVNVTEGVEISIPELSYNKASGETLNFSDLVFDIDEINEADESEDFTNYSIVPTDYNDIKVTVNVPGVYTFRAKYDKEDGDFLKGMAILRLNVFPRLDVAPESDDALAADDRTNNPELTLVHSTANDDGVESATIQLPSIANLGNDLKLKYSTIKVNKVVVKHGADVTVYKDKSQDDETAASKRARIAAVSDDEDEANVNPEDVKDITEVPESVEFSQDGYVKYRIVYANTPDFSIEEKVHVVLMPAVTAQAQQEDKSLTLTPLNGSTLQYYIYWFDNTFPEYPGSTTSDGQEPDAAMSILEASTEMNTWNTSTESVTVQRPNDAGENEDVLYAVRYRAAKDISDVVTEIESIDNSDKMLYSDYVATGISSSGTTTGVEGIVDDRDDNDAPAVYYNLQGVRMDGRRLAPGVYICVKGSTSTKVLVGK